MDLLSRNRKHTIAFAIHATLIRTFGSHLMNKPLTFYSANTPNGHKISVFLEEAQLPYEEITIDLGRKEQKTPSFLAMNPNGKIPVIVDHQRGEVIFESGAILSYLSKITGCLLPHSFSEELKVQQWLYFQVGSIGPMLGQLWWFLHGEKEENLGALKRYRNETCRLFEVIDYQLSKSKYIATDSYSIADIANFTWLRTYEELELDISNYKNIKRWLNTIESREAVQKVFAH
nr:glutathione binding-like protein [Pseudomonas luteola]